MSTRSFVAKPATLAEVPLLIGLIGPPGGGKTWSALRLATGMQQVRPGPIVLIDTERGRASKYSKDFDFLRVDFAPPFRPTDFLEAVTAQLPLNPAAIIVDSLSDEHEGEGGVLDWHDADVPKMGGNEWAAWAKPKASRRTMINGFLQIKVPLIFTFRAREKTKQLPNDRGKITPTNIGYQPIAPSEIIYALDLTCILPPKADGVPIWRSDKVGEDFIIKLPNYLKPFIKDGVALDEEMGKAFATWARGGETAPDLTEEQRQAILDDARDKASDGEATFHAWYDPLSRPQKALLKPIKGELSQRMKAAKERAEKAAADPQTGEVAA